MAETFDYEIIDKAYAPYDNLSLLVSLQSTGTIEKKVIASVTEALKADPQFPDWNRLVEIFRNPSLADTYNALMNTIGTEFKADGTEISRQTIINMPPRLRMTTLYAISQSLNGRVANTCNLSEDWVGYSTRYGDAAGDFAPLGGLTVAEVKAIGRELGLPMDLVDKTPSDGLSGKSDEDNLGFTYAVLDRYIRTGVCDDPTRRITRR